MDPTPDRPTRDDTEHQRAAVRERTRRQLLAVAVATAVLVLAGAVALVLAWRGDGDDTGSPPAPTRTPDEPAPDDGPRGQHPSGLDVSHPLVGSEEARAREVYPLVRVEWRDGEAKMLTMDLLPGRVGLAVEDGTIVAAGAEGCEELPPDAATWQQQACDPAPDDGATVWGRLLDEAGALVLEPGAGADRYYERMQVAPWSSDVDDQLVAVDMDGTPVSQDDLRAGQSVWLWTSGPCEERYPVACPLDAIVVED